jgi:hypothetical protein
MSSNRYIEFNSSFRDRNLWPLPAQFEIPISQTGRKGQQDALDPVCLSSPIIPAWTCQNFNMGGNIFVCGILNVLNAVPTAAPPPPGSLLYNPSSVGASDPYTFILQTSRTGLDTKAGNGTPMMLQQLRDYYTSSVIVIPLQSGALSGDGVNLQRRITEYIYLYSTEDYDFGQITTSGALTSALVAGQPFYINDPSAIGSPCATVTSGSFSFNLPQGVFFVPFGRTQRNAYIGDTLYNETRRQFRYITTYEGETTKLLSIDIQGPSSFISGPITGNADPNLDWTITDNYCIRKEKPFIPKLGEPYPDFVSSVTDPVTGKIYNSSNFLIILQGGFLLSDYTENFFKNCGLRILPNPGHPTTANRYYNYYLHPPTIKTSTPVTSTNLIPPLGEERVISYSKSFVDGGGNNTIILEVYPPFSIDPYTPADQIYKPEILFFSYDNFSPFIYTGSLVSQQDMVCYEIELVNLIVPNQILSVGFGGLPAFYPYLYVELSNVSAPGGGIKNSIYSNVPAASKATFRVPVDDIPSPLVATFIKIDGDGMVQTLKFKPNDNLFFSVFFYNGEIYNTIIREKYAPYPPEATCQISCIFSFRRL